MYIVIYIKKIYNRSKNKKLEGVQITGTVWMFDYVYQTNEGKTTTWKSWDTQSAENVFPLHSLGTKKAIATVPKQVKAGI